MKLFYSPGACSLASHIALVEDGGDFDTVKVDLESKKTDSGQDFREISPRAYVPALDTEYGLITENPAVLTFIAERTGALPDGEEYFRMLEWIGFVGTEIHGEYPPLFHGGSDEEKEQARKALAEKYALADRLIGGKDWLVGDAPTVADNYLFVTTLWADKMNIELPQALVAYRERNLKRDSVQQAMADEGLG